MRWGRVKKGLFAASWTAGALALLFYGCGEPEQGTADDAATEETPPANPRRNAMSRGSYLWDYFWVENYTGSLRSISLAVADSWDARPFQVTHQVANRDAQTFQMRMGFTSETTTFLLDLAGRHRYAGFGTCDGKRRVVTFEHPSGGYVSVSYRCITVPGVREHIIYYGGGLRGLEVLEQSDGGAGLAAPNGPCGLADEAEGHATCLNP